MVAVASLEWQDVMSSTFPDTPARQAFREAVATVAAQARAALPDCTGRIDKAVALVLAGDVAVHPDGTATVGSQTSTRTYTVNGSCTCTDYENAPEGRCKHRLARWIHKKATTLATAQMQALDTPRTEGETWVEQARNHPALVAGTPLALPEAPASINVRLVLHGREVQITLRDQDETRLRPP